MLLVLPSLVEGVKSVSPVASSNRAASSPQVLRRANLETVLAALRDRDAVTVTDVMAETGLTRATVFAVCED